MYEKSSNYQNILDYSILKYILICKIQYKIIYGF